MENFSEAQPIAYLRSLHLKHQCELTFHLRDTINGIDLNEEIKALRAITDTVGSLLQHIQNKLNKLVKTKKNDEAYTPVVIPLRLEYQNKVIESDEILQDVIKHKAVHVFHIQNARFKVIVNAPLIQIAVLPSLLFKNSIVQPVQFEGLHTSKQVCEHEWYSSVDKVVWVKVGDKFTYKIQDEDVGRYLKFRCIPTSYKGVVGPAYEVVSERMVSTVPAAPKKCPFHERQQLHTPTKLTGKQFRVVSYNILSHRYAKSDYYPYCPLDFLAIEYRRRVLLDEIVGYKADVICLQELDRKEYEHFFKFRFNKFGYQSVFNGKGKYGSEGMGCVFNSKKFEMIHFEQLLLADGFASMLDQIKESINYGPDVEKLHELCTSLQVTVLQSKLLNRRLIVANTHLYYHPDGFQIRLLQVNVITRFLNDLQQRFQQDYKGKVTVIFCGDFNSVPTSAVYHFLMNGKIADEHKEILSTIKNTDAFTHSFAFKSACGTPKYTNYTQEFKDCLDYIFYDTKCLESPSFVPFPDETVLSENTALPSKVFPSDHLALIADMQFL